MSRSRRYLALAVLLAGFAAAPLAPGYFMEAHDGPHSLFFLLEFDRAIGDGALIPRWGTDHAYGYGYPTFVFYSPLAYYLAEGFHLAGAGITDAVKLTYALTMVLAAVGMFALVRGMAGPTAAVVASVVYAYAPYRFVDVYVRSALAESLALALFPWALWGFWRLTRRPDRRGLALAAACYAALLLSHNLTAILFTPLLTAFVPLALAHHGRERCWRTWGRCLGAGVLAVGIAAFSLLPMVLERQHIVQEQWTRATYRLTDHFVYPGQLLSPFWGYGYAVPGPDDGMAMQLGLVPLVLAVAGLLLGTVDRRLRAPALFFGLALAGYTALTLPVSAPAWEAVPAMALVQFPWRLLAIAVLCAAVLAGIGGRALARLGDAAGITAALIALVAVAAGIGYAAPQHTPPSSRAETPLLVVDFEQQHPDMVGMTAWVQEAPTGSAKVEALLAGETPPLADSDVPGAAIEVVHHGGHVQMVRARLPQPGEVRFRTYYYPGWRAYVDGQETPLWPSGPQAVITLAVPAGDHVLEIRFGDTPLRAVAKWITLGGVAVLITLIISPASLPGRRPQC